MSETFEFTTITGKACRLEATYSCIMKDKTINLDGDKFPGESEPYSVGNNLVAFVDGEKFDSAWDPTFWRLIDVPWNGTTAKKIWGLNVGFANPEDAIRYEKWITDVVERGTSNDVKAYREAQKEEKLRMAAEEAQKIVAKAEKQKDIPPQAEADYRMRKYNEINNDGGFGCVPHIISAEEYEAAKQAILEYDEYMSHKSSSSKPGLDDIIKGAEERAATQDGKEQPAIGKAEQEH